MASNGVPRLDSRISNGIAVWVSLVWGVSFIADIFMTTYKPSLFIHGTMLAVVGAALGISNTTDKPVAQKKGDEE